MVDQQESNAPTPPGYAHRVSFLNSISADQVIASTGQLF